MNDFLNPELTSNKDEEKDLKPSPQIFTSQSNDETPKPPPQDPPSENTSQIKEFQPPKKKSCKMRCLKIKKFLSRVFENKIYTILMTLITIYCLFGDDFWQLATPKPADDYFYAFTVVSLTLFGIEIILLSIVKEGYFLGFYFWLDLISTLSLITDIGWIMEDILGDKGQ